jgi:phosphatidylserine/phosphatidylglycerophosphate/cardiolipin synthase-like enzyme
MSDTDNASHRVTTGNCAATRAIMPADEDVEPAHSRSVWRYARATRAHVVIDAAAYFELMQDAFLEARQRIFLIGWDFDSRIRLGRGRRWWNLPRKRNAPARLGAFFIWLVKRREDLEIRLLKWNFGALKFIFRGSMIIDLTRWLLHRQIDFKFDSAHPLGCSHHQKIVVIDDRMAVCGGIDMTSDRWDTREHLHEDTRRRRPNGKLYGPWHDVTMMMEGDVAAALGDLGPIPLGNGGRAARPLRAAGNPVARAVAGRIHRCRDRHRPHPGAVERAARNARDRGAVRRADRAAQSGSSMPKASISPRAALPRHCRAADRARSARNPADQSGNRRRLAGTGGDGYRAGAADARDRAEKDHASRFRMFIPKTSGGAAIYVHAKLMIVDDEIIRVGSAN